METKKNKQKKMKIKYSLVQPVHKLSFFLLNMIHVLLDLTSKDYLIVRLWKGYSFFLYLISTKWIPRNSISTKTSCNRYRHFICSHAERLQCITNEICRVRINQFVANRFEKVKEKKIVFNLKLSTWMKMDLNARFSNQIQIMEICDAVSSVCALQMLKIIWLKCNRNVIIKWCTL